MWSVTEQYEKRRVSNLEATAGAVRRTMLAKCTEISTYPRTIGEQHTLETDYL